MTPNTYLFLDTETGGLDPRIHSLLTIGLVAGDASGVWDSLEIAVKHEPYTVSGGGMKVNRIDLAAHHERAVSPAGALDLLDAFLDRNYPADARVSLVGHNIGFDHAFLKVFLESQGRDPEGRFHHRSVDTHAVASALRDAGRLPLEKLSSDALFAHFGVAPPEDLRHTALGDALATFELYWKLVGLMA
jgi:DNA polymerase III alpha subunit (gram-positive type)